MRRKSKSDDVLLRGAGYGVLLYGSLVLVVQGYAYWRNVPVPESFASPTATFCAILAAVALSFLALCFGIAGLIAVANKLFGRTAQKPTNSNQGS